MKKITSFTVDHLRLLPGIYVSRKDTLASDVITTFDLRMTRPNFEPVMNTAEIHAIEHLGSTYLRNHKGFYLLLKGDYESKDIVELMIELYKFIKDYEGEIPGQSPKDCGNYLDMNLGMAKYLADKYLEVLLNIGEENLIYPE